MRNPDGKTRFLDEIQLYSLAGEGLDPEKLDPAALGLTVQQCAQFRRYAVAEGVIYEDENGYLWSTGFGPNAKKEPVVQNPVTAQPREISEVIGFMGQSIRVVREGNLDLPTGLTPLWQVVEIQLPSVRFQKALLWVSNDPDRGPWTPLATLGPTLARLDTDPPEFPSFVYRGYKYLKVGMRLPREEAKFIVIEMTDEIKLFLGQLLNLRSED